MRRIASIRHRRRRIFLGIDDTQQVRRQTAPIGGRVVGDSIHAPEWEVLAEQTEHILGRLGERRNTLENLREKRAGEGGWGEAAFHIDILSVRGNLILM